MDGKNAPKPEDKNNNEVKTRVTFNLGQRFFYFLGVVAYRLLFILKTCYFYYFAPFTIAGLNILAQVKYQQLIEGTEETPNAAAPSAI